MKNLINHHLNLFETPPEKVLYCYHSDLADVPQGPHITPYKGLPDSQMLKLLSEENEGRHFLIVLDDLLEEIRKNSELVNNIACVYSHHYNLSCCLITQDLFSLSKIIRSNANVIILFRSPANQSSIQSFGRQIFCGRDYRYFMDSFKDATSEPYGNLVVCLHPKASPKFRLITEIFSPYPSIFLPRE